MYSFSKVVIPLLCTRGAAMSRKMFTEFSKLFISDDTIEDVVKHIKLDRNKI